MPPVRLRPVEPSDRPFLLQVYASTRYDVAALVDWTEQQKTEFTTMQFEAQDHYYHEQFLACEFSIIEVDGQAVGRLYLDRRPEEIRIVDIALLPQHRRRGFGSQLLHEILAEARSRGLPVRIHVESDNPALQLYERLGFRALGRVGVYHFMECTSDPTT